MWKKLLGFLEFLRKLPIQGRKERWRNRLDAYKKEKIKLLGQPPNYNRSRRLVVVFRHINELNRLLENN